MVEDSMKKYNVERTR